VIRTLSRRVGKRQKFYEGIRGLTDADLDGAVRAALTG